MKDNIRTYSAEKDKKAVQRVWKECGWMGEEKKEAEVLDIFLKSSKGVVYEMGGDAECLVVSTKGRLFHTGTALQHSAITSVATSRIARNLGIASKTLARVLANDVAKGAAVSGLGVFEQGFYNRLGYGNGVYENWIGFDPAWLVPLPKARIPERFAVTDWKKLHDARLSRRKSHGAVDLLPPEITKADMLWIKKCFGLGYTKNGKITHYIEMTADNAEEGPYTVVWMVYQNLVQFRELLSLLAGLSDQIRQIKIQEPTEVQLQDFIKKPFQLRSITQRGKYEYSVKATAYWQFRILDLKTCIGAVKCRDSLTFNLHIEDPIEKYLPAKSTWRGCSGDYIVSFGPKSSIKKGTDPGADTLKTTIGDFSRFWLGVQSAEVLNISGVFEAPVKLLKALDKTLVLPKPNPDWEY